MRKKGDKAIKGKACINSLFIHIKVCMWQMDICVQEGMPVLAQSPQKALHVLLSPSNLTCKMESLTEP